MQNQDREEKKHEEMNKIVLLVYIFYVLYECIRYHSIEYQDNAESILLIYFSISDLVLVRINNVLRHYSLSDSSNHNNDITVGQRLNVTETEFKILID